MSKPVLGVVVGLMAGCVIGVMAIYYFEIQTWFDRWCVLGSAMLIAQLLGATIASALGKPHQAD